jgi:asparagine synthase (glutamine-hydrolysing)
MCGICGINTPEWEPGLGDAVACMNAALAHRGPDDSGHYVDEHCSLAMRRLSIIDLVTGRQPITNEDDTLVIVFNGEIYNFRELRKDLERSRRHRFKTQSDTEVILHVYEDEGEDTPKRLKGMFAFCIYDKVQNRLFIARDRFGEKPLYYTVIDGAFGFSSELTSLAEWPAMSRRIDRNALFYLLHLGYIPPGMTLFQGVHQLSPGHWLVWEQGNLNTEEFFQPVYRVEPAFEDEEVAKEALRDTVLRAVKSQMVSDVPLGAFLSGGFDSSTVVAAMQRQSSQPIQTFTVRFEQSAYDESPVARQIAEHLGTEHHEFVITDAGFKVEDVLRIIEHTGQPFLDSSAIPTYYISRSMRQHVTVALSGDGGDEMFGGYLFYPRSLAVDRLAAILPKPVLHAAQVTLSFASSVPILKRYGKVRFARRATEVAALHPDLRPGAMEELFTTAELAAAPNAALRSDWCHKRDTFTPALMSDVRDASRLRQLMYYRVKFSLAEDMLTKVDRMSMATSLEVRAPLLSTEVSDFSMTLPDRHIIRNGTKKYLLREAVRPWLPDIVFSLPKFGFGIPLHLFQNNEYKALSQDYVAFSKADSVVSQLFSPDMRRQIVDRGIVQKSDAADLSVYRSSHHLWLLLQLGLWAERFRVVL